VECAGEPFQGEQCQQLAHTSQNRSWALARRA
jgi:hypothetical protein